MRPYFVLFLMTKMYQQWSEGLCTYRKPFAYDLATLMFIMSILRDLLPCGIVYLADTALVWHPLSIYQAYTLLTRTTVFYIKCYNVKRARSTYPWFSGSWNFLGSSWDKWNLINFVKSKSNCMGIAEQCFKIPFSELLWESELTRFFFSWNVDVVTFSFKYCMYCTIELKDFSVLFSL